MTINCVDQKLDRWSFLDFRKPFERDFEVGFFCVWASKDGATWTELMPPASPPWNAGSPAGIKYDFDALVIYLFALFDVKDDVAHDIVLP